VTKISEYAQRQVITESCLWLNLSRLNQRTSDNISMLNGDHP